MGNNPLICYSADFNRWSNFFSLHHGIVLDLKIEKQDEYHS
jgi:hypothetical protein